MEHMSDIEIIERITIPCDICDGIYATARWTKWKTPDGIECRAEVIDADGDTMEWYEAWDAAEAEAWVRAHAEEIVSGMYFGPLRIGYFA